jgi:hypothetical protein
MDTHWRPVQIFPFFFFSIFFLEVRMLHSHTHAHNDDLFPPHHSHVIYTHHISGTNARVVLYDTRMLFSQGMQSVAAHYTVSATLNPFVLQYPAVALNYSGDEEIHRSPMYGREEGASQHADNPYYRDFVLWGFSLVITSAFIKALGDDTLECRVRDKMKMRKLHFQLAMRALKSYYTLTNTQTSKL